MTLKKLLPTITALLLGIYLGAQHTVPGMTQARERRATLITEVADLELRVAQLPVEQAREKTLKAEEKELAGVLPDDEQLPNVLNDLGRAARALGVESKTVSRQVRASDVPGITAVDLDLDLKGTYARTQALIQTVARLPRAYTTRSIQLGGAGPGLVTGKLQLTTYKRDTAPTPGAGTASTGSTSPVPTTPVPTTPVPTTPGTPATGGTP